MSRKRRRGAREGESVEWSAYNNNNNVQSQIVFCFCFGKVQQQFALKFDMKN